MDWKGKKIYKYKLIKKGKIKESFIYWNYIKRKDVLFQFKKKNKDANVHIDKPNLIFKE